MRPTTPTALRETPFVGRVEELAYLAGQLGRTASILIEGEAGIGKTRTLLELQALANVQNRPFALVRVGGAGPTASLPQLLAAIDDATHPSGTSRLSKKLERFSPALLIAPRNPDGTRSSLFVNLSSFIEANIGPGLALAIDDIHWADQETLLFLEHLASSPLEKLLLVLTARPRITASPAANAIDRIKRACTVLPMTGLGLRPGRRLFEALSGPIRVDESTHLQQVTGGNPLFIKELATHLDASGLLSSLTLEEALERAQIPRSLTSFLDTVIDSLPSSLSEVLEAAACVGMRFNQVLVQEISSLESATIEDALGLGWQQFLLRRVDGPEVTDFEFAHPLLRERIYRGLTPSRRRNFHNVLARLGIQQKSLFTTADLALHAARGLFGDEASLAVESCSNAAEDAEQIQAFEAAAKFWAMALSKTTLAEALERARLFNRLARAHRGAGNWELAKRSMFRARELFDQECARRPAAEAALFIGEISRWQLHLGECVEWSERALAESDNFPDLRLSALAMLGAALTASSEITRGVAILRQAIEEAGGAENVPPDLAHWASFGLSAIGLSEESRRLATIGLDTAQQSGDRTYTALLAGQLIFSALQRLDLGEASDLVGTLRQIPRPHDIIATVRVHYGDALVEAYKGNWRVVARIANRWRREVRLAGPFHRATAEVMHAEALSVIGRHREAIQLVDQAIPNLERERSLGEFHRTRILLRAGQHPNPDEILASGERIAYSTYAYGTKPVLADIVASLGIEKLAKQLIPSLATEEKYVRCIYVPVSIYRVLGKLHKLLGDSSLSFHYFDLALNHLAVGGAKYELALCYLDYAAARASRGKRGDNTKAHALQREGELLFEELRLPIPVDMLGPVGLTGRSAPHRFGLSTRETEVLRLVAQGQTNREIAVALGVTAFTVARHIERILEKTHTTNRTAAAQIAVSERLISA